MDFELSTDLADAARAEAPDICIVLNPGSGKKKDGRVHERIEAAMARHPGRFALHKVPKGGDIAEVARSAAREGFQTLVAAGGDGTICAVAEVAHEEGRTLGVLPMGTFNFFARGLGLSEEIEEALDLIAEGPTRELPLGRVNGRIFLNNASIGVYPAILQQREGTYRRWGRSRIAAHWSVIVTFARYRRAMRLKVSIDGKPIRAKTPLAFVARSAFQLQEFGLDGAEAVRDGQFALFLAPDASRWELAVFALKLMWRSMRQGRDFDLYTGREIVVEMSSRFRLVARDGEKERMSSPLRFEITETPLKVIARKDMA